MSSKARTLEGYAGGLPKEVNARILADHCRHGKLQKHEIYDLHNTQQIGEKFRYFTKLQKKDSVEYYRLYSEAREVLEGKEAEAENKEEDVEEADDAKDEDYVPNENNRGSSNNKSKPKTRNTKNSSKNQPSTTSTQQQKSSTAKPESTTKMADTTSTTNRPPASSPDQTINVNDINSLVKNKCVIKENILVTKPYYKYEQDSDFSQYKRLHYAIAVFALTRDDGKAIKLSFPSGDRTVRVDKPNITGLLQDLLQEVAEELFVDSPEAQEAICETILSGVLKKSNVVDLNFPVDLLQNIAGRE